MGIVITNGQKYCSCYVCASEKAVLNIRFVRMLKNVSYGTEIALCGDCAKDLKLKLESESGFHVVDD